MEKPNNDQKFPEIVKTIPWTGNTDKKCSNENEKITEIVQTGQDLNKAGEFFLIYLNHRK